MKIETGMAYGPSGGGMGGGDWIHRTEKANQPIHYEFGIGWGDCPSGCIDKTSYQFDLYAEANGYRAVEVNILPPTIMIQEYGKRAEFPVSSVRRDALSRLGKMLSFDNRTALMHHIVGKNREALKKLLEEKALSDTEEDVRQAAREALRIAIGVASQSAPKEK